MWGAPEVLHKVGDFTGQSAHQGITAVGRGWITEASVEKLLAVTTASS